MQSRALSRATARKGRPRRACTGVVCVPAGLGHSWARVLAHPRCGTIRAVRCVFGGSSPGDTRASRRAVWRCCQSSVMGTPLPRWRCAVRRGRRRGRPVQGLIGAGSPLCLLSVVTGHLLFDDAGRLLAAGACAGPERDGRGDAAPLVYLRVGGVGGREAAVRGGPGWVRRGGGTSFVGVPSRLKGRPPVTRGLDPRRPAGRAIGVSTTVNPAPWRATTTPSFRRTSIALTTVARDTPNCSVSSRPDGRRSPGANSPSVMRARR